MLKLRICVTAEFRLSKYQRSQRSVGAFVQTERRLVTFRDVNEASFSVSTASAFTLFQTSLSSDAKRRRRPFKALGFQRRCCQSSGVWRVWSRVIRYTLQSKLHWRIECVEWSRAPRQGHRHVKKKWTQAERKWWCTLYIWVLRFFLCTSVCIGFNVLQTVLTHMKIKSNEASDDPSSSPFLPELQTSLKRGRICCSVWLMAGREPEMRCILIRPWDSFEFMSFWLLRSSPVPE